MICKIFFWFILILNQKHCDVASLKINDKIDLPNSHALKSLYNDNQQKKISKIPIVRSVQSNDSFDNIGVVCVNDVCNSTMPSNDTIKTNVIVKVETQINLNQNKSQTIDETPDIPVIVGYAGSNLDSSLQTKPKSVTIIRSDDSPPIANIDFEPPTINSRSDPVYPEIEIKTIPSSGTVSMTDTIRNLLNNQNNFQFYIPYFEPSYNNQYFAEHQNSKFPVLSKKNVFNPVEFKNTRKTPSVWNNAVYNRQPQNRICSCREHSTTQGLNWYPNSNRRISSNDPGSQINDKLAPLN